jgi:DNA-binding beta-propeller fold protein YncE
VDEIRFFIERRGKVTGPVTDDDVRDALREGKLEASARLRLAGTDLWASPRAFLALAKSPGAGAAALPPYPAAIARDLSAELGATPQAIRDVLMFWIAEAELVFGPLSGAQLRGSLEAGHHGDAAAMLVDGAEWVRAALVVPPRRASSISASAVAAVESVREPSVPDPTLGRPISDDDREVPSARAAEPRAAIPSAPRSRPRSIVLGATAGNVAALPSIGAPVRCPICLERIASGLATCPECGEPTATSGPPSTSGTPSIPDDVPGQGVLAMHWRPIVTLGAIATLVCTGIALRYLAPGRMATATATTTRTTPRPAAAQATAAGCTAACWNGEACQAGRCTWQPPNDVGHVAPNGEATIGGPFALPRDVSDALPLDGERFAVALLTGLQIHNARTGGVLGLVTDAPQARRLHRVGPVVYATAPQRIFVVDAATTRLLKTVEMGAAVGDVVVGASGRRVLASLPGAHAVAVLATEYHAEIDRIQFGDDLVGPIGVDDTGKRALTTTGQVPLAGLAQPSGGAVYAFDPSRLASAQDRVRASMVGNPVSVLMTPDGATSWVVLRAEDAIVPLEWLPSGAVRQEARIPTCHEPEQIELVRRGRIAIVRCNEGRAIEVFDLAKRELVHHIPFNARVADLAIAPDGKQAVVALPADSPSDGGARSPTPGFVGIVDLESWAVRVLPVTAEPTRVRLAPDGGAALVLSDRAKVAWVIR